MSTNAVNKVKNAYNNSLCNLSSIKIQLLMILKKGLLTEVETKLRKNSQKGNKILGRACSEWEGRSTTNKHFF